MKHINLIVGFLALIVLIAACQKNQSSISYMSAEEMSRMSEANTAKDYNPEFERLCKDRTPDNWMNMKPMKDGKFTSDVSCWGCMSDNGMSHFCTIEEYKKYLKK